MDKWTCICTGLLNKGAQGQSLEKILFKQLPLVRLLGAKKTRTHPWKLEPVAILNVRPKVAKYYGAVPVLHGKYNSYLFCEYHSVQSAKK